MTGQAGQMTDFNSSLAESEVANLWLSLEQQAALIGGSNIFLKACPGSGKTRTVAARVASAVATNKKLALLSYTRVGAKEISEAVARSHGTVITEDHFVGTLHSFLNKYVLHPFGHLVTGSEISMSIDPEAAAAHDPVGLNGTHFQFNTQSVLSRNAKTKAIRSTEVTEVATAKRKAAQLGVVNYSDSIYACMKVLLKFPIVAKAVANRFDEIIVDEAQDTNEMQLNCLRLIAKAGLGSLVLVGDYDQAIYEFSGSSPAGCERLATDLGLTPTKLTENYRSSQLICDVTARIRGGGAPDRARGPWADLQVTPKLLLFTPGDESNLKDKFDEIIEEAGISPESKSILARNRAFGNVIRGSVRPALTHPFSDLVNAATAGSVSFDQYRDLERILTKRTFGLSRPGVALDRTLIRSHVVEIVRDLPDLDRDIQSWLLDAVVVLDAHARLLSPATTSNLPPLPVTDKWKGTPASAWLMDDAAQTVVETIHDTKGRSIDAVMLVAEPPSQPWHQTNAHSWAAGITSSGALNANEELRLGYVALTRARQLAVLALPTTTDSASVTLFQSAGFDLVG
jgi:DNA helicase-2/ATP-dependent DNA helicase PcrA